MSDIHELLRPLPEEREDPTKAQTKADKGRIRQSIVDLARTFVKDAHYLEGTAGNTPDKDDGNPGGDKKDNAKMLPPNLDPVPNRKQPKNVLAVCAAQQSKVKGFNICSGRSENHPQLGDKELEAYLKKAKERQTLIKDQAFWFPGNQLHPRRYFLKDTPQESGHIVWGESCIGRRHFDCVGLVNFCYQEHSNLKGGWAFDIKQYLSPKPFGLIDQGLLNQEFVLDGDIVVRSKPLEHIGLLFRKGKEVFVIQAHETKKGLTDTAKYKPIEWGKIVRVPDHFLISRKHILKDGDGK